MPKPYVPKKRTFAFPPVERMGQRVLSVRGMTHGYQDRRLFNNVDLEIVKGERVAIHRRARTISTFRMPLKIACS